MREAAAHRCGEPLVGVVADGAERRATLRSDELARRLLELSEGEREGGHEDGAIEAEHCIRALCANPSTRAGALRITA